MRWRWVFIILLFLVLVTAAGGYLYLLTYDFNKLKPVIAKKFEDVTGRKLAVGGEISIRMGLVPALALEGISIRNAPWGSRPEMVKLKVLQAQVALLPLLKGRLEVKRLLLLEPHIFIETSREGRSNLDFRTQGQKKDQESPGETANGLYRVPLLLFRQVLLKNGTVTLVDNRAGRSHRVFLREFSSWTRDGLSPIRISFVGAYNGSRLKIEGSTGPLLQLVDPLKPWSLNLMAQLGDNSVVLDGSIMDLVQVKGLRVSVAVSGPSVRKTATSAGVKGAPDLGPFTGRFSITDTGGRLRIKDLDIRLGTKDKVDMDIKGRIEDPLGRRGLNIHFLLRGASMAALTRTMGAPLLPFRGPFTVQGDLVGPNANRYRLTNLEARFEKNDLRGSLEITLSRDRPGIVGTLSSTRMDLRRFYREKASKHKSQGMPSRQGEKKKVFPCNPLPFPDLKKADLDLRIKAKHLLLRRMALRNLTSDLKINNGRITIKSFNSSVGGGALSLSFDSEPLGETRSVSATLFLDQLDVKSMVRELGVNDTLEGRLKIELALAGKGRSVSEMLAGINGRITLSIDGGRFDNKFLRMLGAEFATMALRLFNPFEEDKEFSEINCLVSHFEIHDGLARSKALVLDTDYMSFVGSGEIDLKTEELDFSVKPVPKKGIGVKGIGRLSISMGELAKPLKLSGTLAQPSLAVDPKQTVILVGKALGGIALFGPLGIAAVLAGGSFGDKNPCIAAVETIEKSPLPILENREQDKKTENEADEGAKDSINKVFRDIGTSLKNLFKSRDKK